MNTNEIRETLAPFRRMESRTDQASAVKLTADRLSFGRLNLDLTPHVLGELASALPVPAPYFQSVPRELAVPHYQYAIDQLGDAPVTLVLDGSAADTRLLGVLVGDADVPTSPLDTLDALVELRAIPDWETFELTPTAWRYLAITERGSAVRVGDITKIGYEVAGSLIGRRALSISLMTWRLMCLNGAIHATGGGSFRRNQGGGDGLGDWMSDALDALDGRGEHVLADLERAATEPVTADTLTSLDVMFRAMRFSQARQVRRRIQDDPPETVYDLIQHVTWVATHSDTGRSDWGTFRRRRKMQAIAGGIVGQLSTCDSCHQLVAGGAISHAADDLERPVHAPAGPVDLPPPYDRFDTRSRAQAMRDADTIVQDRPGLERLNDAIEADEIVPPTPAPRRGRKRSFEILPNGKYYCEACADAFDSFGAFRDDRCPAGHTP